MNRDIAYTQEPFSHHIICTTSSNPMSFVLIHLGSMLLSAPCIDSIRTGSLRDRENYYTLFGQDLHFDLLGVRKQLATFSHKVGSGVHIADPIGGR